jgi:Uma2 family endonuclease
MMYERIEDEVDFSNDFSPMEEESMPETALHAKLIQYLVEVLEWLFHGGLCAIHRNLAFYQARERHEPAVAPDIAVIKGYPFQFINSWRVGKTGRAPHVVLEILSGETWKKDVEEKPQVYARMGVHEYFAYDPNLPPLAEETTQRLFGWRLDFASQRMVALPLQAEGSLLSQELDSLLVREGPLLRLYDKDGHLRLTGEEAAERQAASEAIARRVAERRAEAEAAARRAAERHAEALAEKLRSLGFDPD